MRKIWDKFVGWLYKVPFDKWLHYLAGLIIAAFFALALHMAVCVVPAIFAGFIKEFYDKWTTDRADWRDFLATTLGGLTIQLFVALGWWWGFFAL